jgi:hypothetical protein
MAPDRAHQKGIGAAHNEYMRNAIRYHIMGLLTGHYQGGGVQATPVAAVFSHIPGRAVSAHPWQPGISLAERRRPILYSTPFHSIPWRLHGVGKLILFRPQNHPE